MRKVWEQSMALSVHLAEDFDDHTLAVLKDTPK
jgi:hypothetical protein